MKTYDLFDLYYAIQPLSGRRAIYSINGGKTGFQILLLEDPNNIHISYYDNIADAFRQPFHKIHSISMPPLKEVVFTLRNIYSFGIYTNYYGCHGVSEYIMDSCVISKNKYSDKVTLKNCCIRGDYD